MKINRKVAVIGNGSIGRQHANNIGKLNLYGCKYEPELIDSDPIKMSSSKLDDILDQSMAAVICVPASYHVEMLKRCLDHNLPVYLEKPACRIEDIDELKDISKRPGLPTIMVGYQLRFHDNVNHIKGYARQYDSGGSLICHSDMSEWEGQSSTGHFLSEFSHEIDLAMYLGAGKVKSWVVNEDARLATIVFEDNRWIVKLSGGCGTKYLRSWTCGVNSGAVQFVSRTPRHLDGWMYYNAMKYFLALERDKMLPRRFYKQAKGTLYSAPQPKIGCSLRQSIKVMELIRMVSK